MTAAREDKPQLPDYPATVYCKHYVCQCARARELLVMGMTREAVEVHKFNEQVRCRQEAA